MIPMENTHSADLGSLFEALAKAQGKIEHALKDKKNPFFKSSYADLTSVWEACREPLSSNGLCVIQTIEGTKEAMFLMTWLGHSSGQWMKSRMPLFIMKQDPQSVGSSITYGKRYALSAMVGICADEDDDGEKAMGRKPQPEKVDPNIEKKTVIDFLCQFPDEEQGNIEEYLRTYSSKLKKTMIEAVNDYATGDLCGKFEAHFSSWKEKRK